MPTKHRPAKRSQIRRFQSLLTGQKAARNQLLELKSASLQTIEEVLALLPPQRRSSLFGWRRTYESLSSYESAPLYTASLEAELTWAVARLRADSDHLRPLLECEKRFFSALIRGDFRSASDALTSASDVASASIWMAENVLLLAEYSEGLHGNRQAAKRYLEGACYPYSTVIAFHSLRIERRMNVEAFIDELQGFIRKVREGSRQGTGADDALAHLSLRVGAISQRETFDIASAMHTELAFSSIDLYHGTIRALQHISAQRHAFAGSSRIATLIDALSSKFESPTLAAMRRLHLPSTPLDADSATQSLLGLVSMYTRGAYAECLSATTNALTSYPETFEFYELAVKCALRMRCAPPNPFNDGSIGSDILASMYGALALDLSSIECAERLGAIGLALDGIAIGQCLQALRLDIIGKSERARVHRLQSLSHSASTPRFAQFIERNRRDEFLALFATEQGLAQACGLFSPTLREAPVDAIPMVRRRKYQGQAAMNAGDFDAARRAFSSALELGPGTGLERRELVEGLVAASVADRALDSAAELLVSERESNPHSISRRSVSSVIDEYRKSTEGCSLRNIVWPVLHLMDRRAVATQDKGALFAAADNFMLAHGAERPSDLIGDKLFPADHWVVFLRDICVTDVLDYSVAYSSSNDLDDERVKILQELCKIDQDNVDKYSKEISRLTQQQMLRQALIDLGRGKIYVDAESIRKSFVSWAKPRYERLKSYEMLDSALQLIRVTNDKVLIVDDLSLSTATIFSAIFSELRARFLSSNEFGLDSYLSLRIRHGTLSGHLRNYFQRERLLSVRAGEAYSSNVHWLTQLSSIKDSKQRSLDAAFAELSSHVDSIVEDVRSNWIQIKSATRPDGLFDFDFTETDLTRLQAAARAAASYDEFVRILMNELWRRCESVLIDAQRKIETELQRNLLGVLEAFEQKVYEIEPQLRPSPLSESIARCRDGMAKTTKEVSAWLNLSEEASAPDFELGLLLDTAEVVVGKCFPEYDIVVRKTSSSGLRIKGRYFAPLNDVLFILLANAVQYRSESTPVVLIAERVLSSVVITVENQLPGSSVRTTAAMIERLKKLGPLSVSTGVRNEGGSGYVKLHKLLAYDLESGSGYNVDVSQFDGRFKVMLRVPLERLEVQSC